MSTPISILPGSTVTIEGAPFRVLRAVDRDNAGNPFAGWLCAGSVWLDAKRNPPAGAYLVRRIIPRA